MAPAEYELRFSWLAQTGEREKEERERERERERESNGTVSETEEGQTVTAAEEKGTSLLLGRFSGAETALISLACMERTQIRVEMHLKSLSV